MLHVSLGFGCNNACVFCAQGELRSSSVDDGRTGSVLSGNVRGDVVAFVGGEPTLSDKLPELIREADAAGAGALLVQTNGRRLAYKSYARALASASKKLSLDVSLHGSTEAMHDYHTSTPGSFKQTAVGIRNAVAEGLPVGVTVVVTRSNFRHLTEIVALVKRLGATAIHFARVEVSGKAIVSADRLVPSQELVAPHLAQAISDARRLGLSVDAPARFAGIGVVEGSGSGDENHSGSEPAAVEAGRTRLPLVSAMWSASGPSALRPPRRPSAALVAAGGVR